MVKAFLTVGGVARRLECSPALVRYLEMRGQLSSIRTEGGIRLFHPDDVERLVAERAQRKARA